MSDAAEGHLTYLAQELQLSNRLVGYRLALSLALALELPPTSKEISRTTTYNATGSLDPDGQLRAAVLALRADHEGRPYALMERLAEAGLAHIATHLEAGLPLGDLVGPFAAPSGD